MSETNMPAFTSQQVSAKVQVIGVPSAVGRTW